RRSRVSASWITASSVAGSGAIAARIVQEGRTGVDKREVLERIASKQNRIDEIAAIDEAEFDLAEERPEAHVEFHDGPALRLVVVTNDADVAHDRLLDLERFPRRRVGH